MPDFQMSAEAMVKTALRNGMRNVEGDQFRDFLASCLRQQYEDGVNNTKAALREFLDVPSRRDIPIVNSNIGGHGFS